MFYVLAYPRFEARVAERIYRFRAAHEPERASLVPPHVTLVFGLSTTQHQTVIDLAHSVAARTSEFAVDFITSEIAYDPFEASHKLFLLISTGHHALFKLHRALYDGPQRSEPSGNFPYRPHMTVATNPEPERIERLDTTELEPFPICGRISALEIVNLSGNRLDALETIALSGPAPAPRG